MERLKTEIKLDGEPRHENIGEKRWRDWRWQVKNAVKDIDTFEKMLGISLPEEMREDTEKTLETFPLSITPYYLSLMNRERLEIDPIFRQAFPSPKELERTDFEMEDPLAEERDSPVPGVTVRYPDRALFLVSNHCAMYCRHCTRKRKVGKASFVPDRKRIQDGIDYIRSNSAIRDVLVSGGDPFLLPSEYLDWILGEIRSIEHVEVIRIGTRTPVVLPFRITENLVSMLKKHHPLWINTHFNHPREMTPDSRKALAMLADAGIPLGNQSVLLAGVNDSPVVMKKLVHLLVKNRVRPYYLFQCDMSEGLNHFRTPIGKGIEIVESLIGHTSGYARPVYVIDAPGGGGKIPIQPNYQLSRSGSKLVLRNYEGVITTYQEPENYHEPDPEAIEATLNHKTSDFPEVVGICRLLCDDNSDISIKPSSSN